MRWRSAQACGENARAQDRELHGNRSTHRQIKYVHTSKTSGSENHVCAHVLLNVGLSLRDRAAQHIEDGLHLQFSFGERAPSRRLLTTNVRETGEAETVNLRDKYDGINAPTVSWY